MVGVQYRGRHSCQWLLTHEPRTEPEVSGGRHCRQCIPLCKTWGYNDLSGSDALESMLRGSFTRKFVGCKEITCNPPHAREITWDSQGVRNWDSPKYTEFFDWRTFLVFWNARPYNSAFFGAKFRQISTWKIWFQQIRRIFHAKNGSNSVDFYFFRSPDLYDKSQ